MWDPLESGIKPVSPALAGGYFTTKSPGKPWKANSSPREVPESDFWVLLCNPHPFADTDTQLSPLPIFCLYHVLNAWMYHLVLYLFKISFSRCAQQRLINHLLWLVLCACMLSYFSHVQLFATQRTVDHQAPLSMGFSKQEYWNVLPCSPPGGLLDPGIKHKSLLSLALSGRFFTSSPTWEALIGTMSGAKCIEM